MSVFHIWSVSYIQSVSHIWYTMLHDLKPTCLFLTYLLMALSNLPFIVFKASEAKVSSERKRILINLMKPLQCIKYLLLSILT